MIAPTDPPTRRLAIRAGEAHLWSADLDELGDGWLDLLSAGERERAAASISPSAGRRWGRGRGLLRGLLGAYLGTDPRALPLEQGPHGKPSLADPPHGAPFFNTSHSGRLVVHGFAPDGDVGIDVQVPRGEIDELALAARALGPEPAERLRALDPAERRRAFLRAWTRHEATLKWRGSGIGAPGPPDRRTPWIADLELGPDAVGALALDREPVLMLSRRIGGEPPASSAFAGAGPVAQVSSSRPGRS